MEYIGTIANESPVRSFKAAAAITGEFIAVKLGENGVQTAGAADVPIGILTPDNYAATAAGEDVTVLVTGGGAWQVGEEIKAGDFLSCGEGGKAVKATTGKFIFAQALENAKANQAAQVQIINAGYKN